MDKRPTKEDQIRLDETERRLLTGKVHPVKARILALMKGHAEPVEEEEEKKSE